MNKLIELAKKSNIDLEINKVKSNITQINILDGKERSFEVGNNSTYIIKAIKDDKCAKITTENIENSNKIIENLENIFSIQENENKNILCKGNIDKSYTKNEELDFQKIKSDILSLDKLKEKYPIQTMEVDYAYCNQNNEIVNEEASLKSSNYYHEYLISITLNKNDIRRKFETCYYAKNYDFEAFKNFFMPILDDTVIKLNSSTSCKTDKYNVILKNNVVADILSTFSPMFKTKMIELKESVLSDKFNKKIFNEKITIIEDPQNENNIQRKFFDREGTPTMYQVLVENGSFIKQINDTEYALKTGVEPTGNADGVNNLYIKPGSKSYKELISEMKDGIILDAIMGLHCGIDIKTGAISIEAQGLKIENGEIKSGLNSIILATNLFEIFNNVLDVGLDLSETILEVRAPSLLLNDITIAGEGND